MRPAGPSQGSNSAPAGGSAAAKPQAWGDQTAADWPLWEVFIRSQHGLAHKHVGSLHAVDAEMAITNARDVYTRRNEGVSIWVARSSDIHASSPADRAKLFEPSNDKVYRHPTFFPMPDEVKHI